MGRKKVGANREAATWLALLGATIRLGRIERGWTQHDLATRIGASANTVAAIEKGSPSTSVGLVLNAASMTGVPLFGAQNSDQLRTASRVTQTILALLPKRVRPATVEPRSTGPLSVRV